MLHTDRSPVTSVGVALQNILDRLQQATGGWFWTYVYEIHQAHDWNIDRFWMSTPEFLEYRQWSTSYEAMGAYTSGSSNLGADRIQAFARKESGSFDELKEDLMDSYVTFLAGIFRSVRFGAASAHGRANAAQFSYFQERGAFAR